MGVQKLSREGLVLPSHNNEANKDNLSNCWKWLPSLVVTIIALSVFAVWVIMGVIGLVTAVVSLVIAVMAIWHILYLHRSSEMERKKENKKKEEEEKKREEKETDLREKKEREEIAANRHHGILIPRFDLDVSATEMNGIPFNTREFVLKWVPAAIPQTGDDDACTTESKEEV